MPIAVRCRCGAEHLARDEFAGRLTECPDCGRDLPIPIRSAGPLVAESTAEPRKPELPLGQAVADEFELPLPAKPHLVTTSGKAVASCVLGILSLIPCVTVFAGVPAMFLGSLGIGDINRSRGYLQGRGLALTGMITGGIGSTFILVATLILLLVPAVRSAREAARQAQCTNNLKYIMLAMHNYHTQYGSFPPAAVVDSQGRPTVSWRVLLLPYLDQVTLYEQFRLDEPWDGPNNRPLLSQMPAVFACPTDPGADTGTTTRYQAFIGAGTMFDPQMPVSIAGVTDGTSNTIAVVESATPIEWTKPGDLPWPSGAVGSSHPGGFNAAFADGTVRFISDTSAQFLPALITRNGGEVIDPDQL